MSSDVFVYTLSRAGEVGAWSRYVFPFDISNFARLGEKIYIRAGDDVVLFDKTAILDFAGDSTPAQSFPGVVQWPWLDLGSPGVTKILAGFDITTDSNAPKVAIGFDETNPTAYTTDYVVPPDTVPGTFIPLTIMAPTFSPRLTFDSTDQWTVHSVTLYVQETRPTA